MGLDASVRCRCHERGRLAEAPVAWKLDADGWPTRVDGDDAAAQAAFGDWLATVCEHPRMELVHVRIGGWPAIRAIRRALLHHGGKRSYPAMLSELPRTNAGAVPAEAARRALEEIDLFRRLVPTLTVLQLVDVISNREIASTLPGHTERVVLHQSFQGLLTRQGSFQVVRELPAPARTVREPDREVLFESTHFAQEPLMKGRARFRDTVDDHAYEAPFRLSPNVGGCSERIGVRTRNLPTERYLAALEPLRQAFAASVETGNPVRWF